MDGCCPKRCGTCWALVGLHLLSRPAMLELDRGEAVLLGCAHLLGLLLDRAERRREALAERARRAENELRQIKLVRAEDAKANEKVVAMFASHEHSWITERKSLRLQIRALATQLQSLRHSHEENVSDLNYRITETECEIRAKQEALEAQAKKREELLKKLQYVEREVEELREEVQKKEQHHLRELRKHEDAMAEFIASRDRLEEELARALEQAEAAKQELDLVFERKEEAMLMADKLSDKIGRMQSDAEQKDKILSALLRKSKLDAAEKQMLLKEVKIVKAKKKQAELEGEKWRGKWESRHKKVSSRSSSYLVEAESSHESRDEMQAKGNKNLLLDYFESEGKGESVITAIRCLDQYSSEELSGGEIVTHDMQNLQGWVRMETEKYAAILEQKHFTEIEAFTEQMRLKDEKLEAFRWRLLSKDMESKRLLSQIEAHEENVKRLEEENFKLEALLVDREGEIKSLKEQFGFFIHHVQRNSLNRSAASSAREAQVKIDSEHEAEAYSARNLYNVTEYEILREATDRISVDTTEHYRDQIVNDVATVYLTDSSPSTDSYVDGSVIGRNEISQEEAKSVDSYDEQQSVILITNSPTQEIEEEKEVPIDPPHAPSMNNTTKEATDTQSLTRKETSWKKDIHALGVSYKIKRLKQQLLVLEKLAGMKHIMVDDACNSPEVKKADGNKQPLKGIVLVIHLLNKQVKRFQSLEDKADDLCRRMLENSGGRNRKEKSRVLGNFLEETFQLQRYMVATGQKLMDIQSKITGNISGSDGLDESVGFNLEQFADVIRTLFRDIQRGLEVRIARIIGDIEGTLACDGIRHI